MLSPNKKTPLALSMLLATIVLTSRGDTPQRQFQSAEWKSGNASIRGGMSQDLINRKIVVGKTKDEIQDLLGKPDREQPDWCGYKVITIGRCRYVWECRLEVV